MTAPASITCPRCASVLPAASLACDRCGALVYGARLEQLAAEAQFREANGDVAGAIAHWEACLRLLPASAQQFQQISERIAVLKTRPVSAVVSPLVDPVAAQARSDPRGIAMLKTAASMLVSIIVYRFAMNSWVAAIGFVVLILVHELGHVVANLYYGIKTSAPIFIPFVGAVIWLRQPFPNAKVEAISGIGGPIGGTIAALACFVWWKVTGQPIALILALFGFMMNLYNLLPVLPLDGGRITAAISPKIWIIGLLGAGWLVFDDIQRGQDFSVLMILVIMSLPRVINTLKSGARRGPYFQISRPATVCITAAYLGLIALLVGFRWYITRQMPSGGLF